MDLSLVGDNGGPGTHTIHAISNTDTFQPEPLNAALKEGLQLVAHAAHRVWDELYIHKKPVSGEMCFLLLLFLTYLSKLRRLSLSLSLSLLPFVFCGCLFLFRCCCCN